MQCANGHEVTADHQFCPTCGTPTTQPGAAASVTTNPAATGSPGQQATPPPGAGYRPPPPPSGPYAAPTYVTYQTVKQSPGWNGLAIASMVLGIVWIYWIGSVLALIFGLVAMSQIRRTDQQGKGMAIAGIALGCVGLCTLVLVIAVASTVHPTFPTFPTGPTGPTGP